MKPRLRPRSDLRLIGQRLDRLDVPAKVNGSARFGLDLGGLWRSDSAEFIPAGAAIAWWLIATVGFCGGYFTGTLMQSAASGQIPQRMRQFLIAVGVLLLAGAGQAASAPSPIPTTSGVLAGLAALCLGATMAFCGALFALRKA